MSVIIQTENLHHRYMDEEEDSLKGVDLAIEKGSFVAILGHNGSGKSTLAKHFNGILTPTEGKVWINGMDTSDEDKLLAIRQTVGMVFQNPDNQIVANVVEDDVAFAPENLGVPSEEIRQRVDNALKQVGMYEYRMHAPHLLSGGQKQRVAIAGVIAMEPEVIVLDEPTAMLDPKGRKEVVSTVSRLCREKGITVVLKDAHTVIASPDGRLYICAAGNAGMAKGGSGDVLAGMIASLLTQNRERLGREVTVTEVAAAGVFLHAAAADLAVDAIGEYGMLATDVIEKISLVCRSFSDSRTILREI